MDIFGIGPLEFIFILLIAMVVVGPRNLGKTGRTIGRFLNRLYRSENWKMLNEASRNLRTLPSRLAREAALDELDTVRKSITDMSENLTQEIRDLDAGLDAWQAPADARQDAQDQPSETVTGDG